MSHGLPKVTAVIIVLMVFCSGYGCSGPDVIAGAEPKAAIIDQLYNVGPNQAFIREAAAILENSGFDVDLYQGDNVTVDFYRELPSYGYKLILFRVHSGALRVERSTDLVEGTYLFTNEPYSERKYLDEQLTDQMAITRESGITSYVFAIGARFVSQSMRGRFPNTVTLMMGCSTIRFPDMAMAFIDKGASAYLGWDASVVSDFLDQATLKLLNNLCTRQMTIGQGVALTREQIGADPVHNARLWLYPDECAGQTISELIK